MLVTSNRDIEYVYWGSDVVRGMTLGQKPVFYGRELLKRYSKTDDTKSYQSSVQFPGLNIYADGVKHKKCIANVTIVPKFNHNLSELVDVTLRVYSINSINSVEKEVDDITVNNEIGSITIQLIVNIPDDVQSEDSDNRMKAYVHIKFHSADDYNVEYPCDMIFDLIVEHRI